MRTLILCIVAVPTILGLGLALVFAAASWSSGNVPVAIFTTFGALTMAFLVVMVLAAALPDPRARAHRRR